jgi:hypothetical protein
MKMRHEMHIERDSPYFQILEKLCSAPEAVRGVSGVMLNRVFDAPFILAELAENGLIRERGWDKGPGAVWIATEKGEQLFREIAAQPPASGKPHSIGELLAAKGR